MFKILEEVVHFYNIRDVDDWPAPELPGTVNTGELGDLGLTVNEEADIIALLKILSDGNQHSTPYRRPCGSGA